MVKGKTVEIEIYRPTQENVSGFSVITSKTKLSNIIGRKQQINQLHKAIDSVSSIGVFLSLYIHHWN